MDRSPTRNITSGRRQASPSRADDQLRLTGSQVNLVARSHFGGLRSPTASSMSRKSRPSSALPSYDNFLEYKSTWKRPMSADNDNLKRTFSTSLAHHSRAKDLSVDDDLEYDQLSEKMSNLKSSYTVSSSRLLKSLLGVPWNSELSETSSNGSETSQSEKSLGRRIQEMAQANSERPSRNDKEATASKSVEFKDTDSDMTKGESHGSSRTESTLCLQDINRVNRNPLINVKLLPKPTTEEETRNDKTGLDMKFQRWFPHSAKDENTDEKSVRFSEQEKDNQLQSLLEDDSGSENDDLEFQFQSQAENLVNMKHDKETSSNRREQFDFENEKKEALNSSRSTESKEKQTGFNTHRKCCSDRICDQNPEREFQNRQFSELMSAGNLREFENDDFARKQHNNSPSRPEREFQFCHVTPENPFKAERKNFSNENVECKSERNFSYRDATESHQTRAEPEPVSGNINFSKAERDFEKLDFSSEKCRSVYEKFDCSNERIHSKSERDKQGLTKPEEQVLIDLTEENSTRKCSSDCPFSCCQTDRPFDPRNIRTERSENLCSQDSPRDSTYEDIVSILHVLEQEEAESLLVVDNPKFEPEPPDSPKLLGKSNEQLRDIYSYLDEVERCSEAAIDTAKANLESVKAVTKTNILSLTSVPRLEELLAKNTVELAHEVLSLRLQVEDQSSGIKLLQQTVSEMKEAARAVNAAHEEAICKANVDAEAAVQRHQKFIKQLLNEKKALNEKVSSLVEDIKSGEDRYHRNLKAVEERHSIELQRVKETQAAAEKLKRDKWIDTKTQKIKEMTVKGLEPELSRMAARQQQELTELRNLHRAELEAVELRATRRTTELLDQLRADLTKDKEETIQRETSALRAKLEKQLEDEQNNLQHQAKRLREEVRREKDRLASLEAQMQDTMMESKRSFERERERDRQKLVQEFQEKTETNQRRHQNELKSLKDTLEIEKEAWMNNYKKQQTTKFLEREAELHHQYKRERDRDIELVIERLENEATQTRLELNQAAENKLRRLREKLEGELKEVELSEATLKAKLSEAKALILEKEDQIVQFNSQLRHVQTEMTQLNKLCEEMAAERSEVKDIIRKEFEAQLSDAAKDQEAIRNEMSLLKTNHVLELAKRDQQAIQAKAEAQKELNQVYNRVKMTVSKKEDALEALRDQHRAALERCSHLEQMLDNQRRNLLLK